LSSKETHRSGQIANRPDGKDHGGSGSRIFHALQVDRFRPVLDPDNKVLLLTGTGDWFIKELDLMTLGDMSYGLVWSIIGPKRLDAWRRPASSPSP
jgi:hypothetical protein